MAPRLHPVGKWVVVECVQPYNETKEGLFVGPHADNDVLPTLRGKVLAVGHRPCGVKAGDIVEVAWSRHEEFRSNGKHIRFVDGNKILGVWDG